MAISNPTTAKVEGVHVDHPTIKEYAKNFKKNGAPVEVAAKRLGMPKEVVERIYREAK